MIITESQFLAHEDRCLADFARRINESGVSIYEIAKGCNLSWETVKAAANSVPVKFATQCRISLYLDKVKPKTKSDAV